MNLNTATQHEGIVAWTGSASRPIDIRHHVNFSFTFEVVADLNQDTVFEIQSAPPDATDPCIAGAFEAVPTIPRCDEPLSAAESLITLPAGTPANNVCKATIPCRPDAYVQVLGKSGDTSAVFVVATLSGPK
jgi:hypothetical protein